MSFTYAGVAVYHAQSVLPNDGDPAVAESVDVCLRDLLDNTAYLNAQMTLRVDFLSAGTRNYTQDSSAFVGINGNGTVILNTNVQIGGGGGGPAKALDIVSPTTFSAASTVTVRSSSAALVSPLTTIGSGGTQALVVNAASDFNGPVRVDGDMDIFGAVDINNDVTLGSSSSDSVQINGTLDVDSDTTFANDVVMQQTLQVHGNATIGNAGTDSHQVRGLVQFNNNVTVVGSVTTAGDVTVGDNLNVEGNCQLGNNDTGDAVEVRAIFRTFGNVSLGSSDGDDLYINAKLRSPLGMGGAGRIPMRPSLGPSSGTNTLTVNSCNWVYFNTLNSGGATMVIDDDGAVDGDFFEFTMAGNITAGRVLTVTGPSGVLLQLVATTGDGVAWGKVVRLSGAWYKAGAAYES